jgi:hypothetical protein
MWSVARKYCVRTRATFSFRTPVPCDVFRVNADATARPVAGGPVLAGRRAIPCRPVRTGAGRAGAFLVPPARLIRSRALASKPRSSRPAQSITRGSTCAAVGTDAGSLLAVAVTDRCQDTGYAALRRQCIARPCGRPGGQALDATLCGHRPSSGSARHYSSRLLRWG